MIHLETALDECLSADRFRLRRQLARWPDVRRLADLPAELRGAIEASRARVAQRLQARPRPAFPEELPVNARRAEIAAAIAAHQVVIVCGETGSGKTTQLPKICLELGRGSRGLIGHTQPRRIAARATASRVAQELQTQPGALVGYKVRFTDRTSAEAYIKVMTDGILLAETQSDPHFAAYDTLIIDEAHERSLNIDFLLGYLKQLLPRRPDLKLIITSATLDAERFARHFAHGETPAPILEVSGRLYPVEQRYRPYGEDDDRDLPEAIVDAVDECHRHGPGDVLVFLPGEREIREAAEALRKRHPAGTEVLPLFARQSAQEQARIFQPGRGRRVVLATNVAETSLTVPGIRYVVDSGLARIKRYSVRNKVEQLQVEAVAQAAARQRAGRCGRVSAGVCIRLYDEADFNKRPPYTDPEILRSSLAGVILRMKALNLGAVEDFPFIDRPQPRAVSDGYQLLHELGAVDERRELTATGRELARIPLDPRIGRMVLAARQQHALDEVLVIAAALSVQDPRDRPMEAAGSADNAHRKWQDERSEFLFYLKLWAAWDEVLAHQTQRKQRDWCRQNFLSFLRMREWRDTHGQLHALCAEHGWTREPAAAPVPPRAAGQAARKAAADKASGDASPRGQAGRGVAADVTATGGPSASPPAAAGAGYEAIHKALLAGLLGNIGLKSDEQPHYNGAHGVKFFPHPGSFLAKKAGRWVMAGEIAETSRLFARCLARIEPEWLEQVGAHLVRRHQFDPHWEKKPAQVAAWERGTLYGILLYARRRVHFGPMDPKLSRDIFIREALVQGELPEELARRCTFLAHNRKLVAQIEELERKARRPDILVDEQLIHDFYDARLPADVRDGASFEAWRKQAEKENPKVLFLQRDELMRHEAAGVTTERFPPELELHGVRCKLAYEFDPGGAADGVSLTLPVAALNQLSAGRCDWLVPGLIADKVAQLVKTLPQKVRHRLGTPAEVAEAFLADGGERGWDRNEALLPQLARHCAAASSLPVPVEAFRPENLQSHLFMNVRVVDEHGRVLAQSRNLAELRARFGEQAAQAFSGGQTLTGEREGITAWDFGELPEITEVVVGGRTLVGFPALVDEGASVALRVFDTPEKAAEVHRAGLVRLFALALREPVKYLEKSLPLSRDTVLQFAALGNEAALRAQIVSATLERACMAEPLPADEAAFRQRAEEARSRVSLIGQELARLVAEILALHAAAQKSLAAAKGFPEVVADVKAQLEALVTRDFVAATPFERLRHYPRYLKAVALRIDKLRKDPARDARLAGDLAALHKPWERERLVRLKARVRDPWLEDFRWQLEELRVQLFAQELRTPAPVSVKRLQKMWEGRERG